MALEDVSRMLYVGIDLHKDHHTAVLLDCWNEKLGELQFLNKPTAFPKLLALLQPYRENGFTVVYGLEDTGGYGWALGLYLIQQGQWVKSINPAFSAAKRQSYATVHKSDSWDAECVARVLKDDLKHLPDFMPDEHFWVMRQLVTRRRGIAKNLTGLVKQLHIQLSYVYPSYNRFFSQVDGKTALAFWEAYPLPSYVTDTTPKQLTQFLQKHSNFSCSTKKAELILHCVQEDGNTCLTYAEEKELVIRGQVRQIRFYQDELKKVEAKLKQMLEQTGCLLHTMTGVDVVTSAELSAEIGDIRRFPTANKLARYAGVAPIFAGSGGKGRYFKSKQGDRSLHDIFLGMAVRQIAVHRTTKTPRNPAFYAYYQRKMAEGKTKKQALVCIMRRLVNIVYSILKHQKPYALPIAENSD